MGYGYMEWIDVWRDRIWDGFLRINVYPPKNILVEKKRDDRKIFIKGKETEKYMS
jgi:hypothetical protein